MAIATQRGALLLDALAAIAVFSIGVLGCVTVQALAIRHVHAGHCRSEAAHLVQALVGRMAAENPATLATRYDGETGGEGYAAFSGLARRLPGADLPANAPQVGVAPGPTPGSRRVTVAVHWQLPGETTAHRHAATVVVGGH